MEQLAYTIAILSIVGQTGALFYWGGKLQAMVTILKEADVDKEKRLRELEILVGGNG